MEKLSVPFDLSTDLRGPSKTSLELRWSPAVGMSGRALFCFFFFTQEGEPHDGHTVYMPLKGKPWRIQLPSFGECVDYRKRT